MGIQHSREEKLAAFGRLLDVMDRLRSECPWDREQTTESLRTNTIEEVYELSDAILSGAPEEIKKELGDVLLHVVFYSKIGEEQGAFDVADVANALCDKLIFRHPHVYGETEASTSEVVIERWEELKQKEKNGNKTVLSGVPSSLPALIKAYRIQDKARGVGFDWQHPEDVWSKVEEELSELRGAITSGSVEDT
ncbi:MAG: nucleoside triphosphate pyrophosphohydrolase, partial [Porphyromonas sp.]